MADIILRCRQCKKETAVSEYVEADTIPCSSCGCPLKLPARNFPQPPKAPEPEKQQQPSVLPEERSTMTAFKAIEEREKKRKKKRKAVWSWTPSTALLLGIFIAGTFILGLFRFSSILAESDRNIYIMIGMLALLVGHLTICVDAFNDNVMQGVLCFFVPFYSMYYLFAETDSFLLRVVVGIFILPFGYDFVVQAVNIGKAVIQFVGKLGGDMNY